MVMRICQKIYLIVNKIMLQWKKCDGPKNRCTFLYTKYNFLFIYFGFEVKCELHILVRFSVILPVFLCLATIMSWLLCLPVSHVSRDHSVSSQLTRCSVGFYLFYLQWDRHTQRCITLLVHYSARWKNPPTGRSEILCVTMVPCL